MGLADDPAWRRLLYYQPTWYGPPRSLVDSPAFFLAPTGKTDAAAELEATLTAFLDLPGARPPSGPADADQHPLCRFPARRKWLTAKLRLAPSSLAPVPCTVFSEWLAHRDYLGVSVVFSAYYSNNPASLFGHTFLRMHRRPRGADQASAAMLDEAINFSAFTDTDNQLLYVLRGLAGGFPGRYSLLPYYLKIQEYNNAERRDLWEYRLALTADEIDTVVRSLWELGPAHIDYYYFDENCSAVILTLLEASRPAMTLATAHPWVIPADTVRTLVETPGLVKQVHYRPSSLTRFLFRYGRLDAVERALLAAAIRESPGETAVTEAIGTRDAASQARVIDALVDLIDYEERLAGTKEPERFPELRQRYLVVRSGLKTPPVPVTAFPEHERPDDGHPTTRVGFGSGSGSDGPFLEAAWRPALHDLGSADAGYGQGLALQFFNTEARYVPRTGATYVSRYDLLTIHSLSTAPQIVRSPAWSLELSNVAVPGCGDAVGPLCRRTYARMGVGTAAGVDMLTAYALALGEVGGSREAAPFRYGAPRALLGVIARLSPSVKASGEAAVARRHYGGGRWVDEREWSFRLTYAPRASWELRLETAERDAAFEVKAGLFRYY